MKEAATNECCFGMMKSRLAQLVEHYTNNVRVVSQVSCALTSIFSSREVTMSPGLPAQLGKSVAALVVVAARHKRPTTNYYCSYTGCV
jgi:hypothetical protein